MAAVSPAEEDWVFTEELRGSRRPAFPAEFVFHSGRLPPRTFPAADGDTEIRWAAPPCNCAKLGSAPAKSGARGCSSMVER